MQIMIISLLMVLQLICINAYSPLKPALSSKIVQGLKTSFRKFAPAVSIIALIVSTGTMTMADNFDDGKTRNLSDAQLMQIVADDLTIRQALNTADFTRSIYSENCRFQDEIDVYPINEYVKGTKALFDASASHTDLVDSVFISSDPDKLKPRAINLKFKETLAFNLPLVHPKVDLSGRLELRLDNDNLIDYSREFWDQSALDVLKTVHL